MPRSRRAPRVWPLLLTVLLLSGPAQAQAPFSVENILRAPFPSEMIAAPSGDRIAWVHSKEGLRSLWTASGPDYQARRVVAADGDDGQRMSDVAFTPNGDQIVYVRGGAANRNGVHANPRSRPAPAERAVWRVSVRGGPPQKVGAGHAPIVAPWNSSLAFLRNGQVRAAPLPLADTTGPTRLFTIRGSAEDLRWAPSGDRLAFVSDRGDHSFVGVYDLDADRLRYLSSGVDQDSNPVWSPEGDRIAFLRIPHDEDPDYSPDRTAHPWSIQVVPLRTGEARTVWTADEGQGSTFQYMRAENQLFWGAEDRAHVPHQPGKFLQANAPAGGLAAVHHDEQQRTLLGDARGGAGMDVRNARAEEDLGVGRHGGGSCSHDDRPRPDGVHDRPGLRRGSRGHGRYRIGAVSRRTAPREK